MRLFCAFLSPLHVPTSLRKYRSPRLFCGWTVYMELLANVTARPVINIDVLLSPTEDLSLQQSIRFISTLMTVNFLLQQVNTTTPYIHTYIHTYH